MQAYTRPVSGWVVPHGVEVQVSGEAGHLRLAQLLLQELSHLPDQLLVFKLIFLSFSHLIWYNNVRKINCCKNQRCI
jgi:hypothetical protein